MSKWAKGLDGFINIVRPLGLVDYESDRISFDEFDWGDDGVAEVEDLSQVKKGPGPLSTKNGTPFVLYIKDHGRRVAEVLAGDIQNSRRVHLTYCNVLERMEREGRFSRYHLKNNPDGNFVISGTNEYGTKEIEGEIKLWVCQQCLKELNYDNFTSLTRKPERDKYVQSPFDYDRFFSIYSSMFPRLKNSPRSATASAGYSSDWKEVSRKVRESVKYVCQECKVDLNKPQHQRLLHVHHVNGVKSDNSLSNLRPLCVTCHKKQPSHGQMYASKEDENLLTKLRQQQGLMPDESVPRYARIQEMVKMIDPALEQPFLKLVHRFSYHDVIVPIEIYDGDEFVFEATFGFEKPRLAVASRVSDSEKSAAESMGWTLLSYEDAMNY